jgi:drug/metabolite transporter (DMT)-like permease
VTALWGGAYALTHQAVETIAPTWVAAGRLVVGALVLALLARLSGVALPSFSNLKQWQTLFAIGAIGSAAPFILISTAQTVVPSGLAAIFIAFAPVILASSAHFVVPEAKLTPLKALGVLIGFSGVVALFLPSLEGSGAAPLWAMALLVLGAGCYAMLGLMVRLSAPTLHPLAFSFGFTATGALVGVLVALLVPSASQNPGAHISMASAVCVVALGLGATGLASLIQVQVTRSAGPIFLSMVGYLAPFFSVALGAVVFQERLHPSAFVALALILLGVFLTQVQRKPKNPASS